MQVNVLEAQYNHMIQKIQQSAEFETPKRIHDDFLAACISQCFVQVKVISHSLSQIYKMAFFFCNMIQRGKEISLATITEISKVELHHK